MELRQLRHFVAVAETGNISRAAKKIFLTQPALSRQIKALEDELGQRLLERRAHSIRLTPAGEVLMREARELLRHADEALARVRAAGNDVRVRVGYAPSLASGLLSEALSAFTQKHPAARVELFDLSTKEMLGGLADETLDVAVTVGEEQKQRGLEWTRLVRAPWRLAVGGRHPLAKRKQVPPAEAAQAGLLMFCRRNYPEYWDIVTEWLRRHKLRPRFAGEYDGVNSLLAAVDAGLGVALVTAGAARFAPPRVQLKPLTLPPEPLCIAAAQRTGTTTNKPLAVFIEELRHAAQTYA
ncbi:MAG: LysR family transcriptional regulator [Verrucomicrobiae bacterium]|nr:LysR family transcriptional regulator [Verrucomicrobiae bacterium]MDW8344018.1 LysR family transcriptional regulator [Verrucomicrobiae bacterium]